MTGHHWGLKQKLRAGYRAPSRYRHAMCHQSYVCLLDDAPCNACHIFHRVWYRALSLWYACTMRIFDVRASSSPRRLPLCQMPSIAELARGEKSRTQSINHWLTHSLTQLIWCDGNRSFCFWT